MRDCLGVSLLLSIYVFLFVSIYSIFQTTMDNLTAHPGRAPQLLKNFDNKFVDFHKEFFSPEQLVDLSDEGLAESALLKIVKKVREMRERDK